MIEALSQWPYRPVTPQGQLHAILTPIIDDFAGGAAIVSSVEMSPDDIEEPGAIHFMITVRFDGTGKSMINEHRRLVERLKVLGFDVAAKNAMDISDMDFHVLASATVDRTTKRLKTSGAVSHHNGATDDAGGIVLDIEQLKHAYELQHLRPSQAD
jgi:hypothetical protein